ncbi:cellulase family glycosylhydrolase [candidate division KSB1 bacterium]|nr:cellulase family glycosylhydrolase [candidate division KSB1 bacterium]
MKLKTITVLCLLSAVTSFGQKPQLPFQRGFNLAGWFEKNSAYEIRNNFTKHDLENIAALGADHIRLPVRLLYLNEGAPDYTLDPVFLTLLDRTVDWAEELGLHIILDNHHFDPAANTNQEILDQLIAVWQQMAEHYKNRSSLVYYEILNEPHDINNAIWNDIQQQIVQAIRTIDKIHTIIVGPANYYTYRDLSQMPVYDDDNLIYTFHFYDPMLFTHQGADWPTPSMADIKYVPYPYDAGRMPELPTGFEGTWLGDAINEYENQGNKAFIKSLLDNAVQFRDDRQVPCYCGEFGALQWYSTTEDRARWTKDVRQILENNRIGWSSWGYDGPFGIFKPGSVTKSPSDLDIPMVEALGLTVPPPGPLPITPDTESLVLYDDYFSGFVYEATWAGINDVDYYNTQDPKSGEFNIRWTGSTQYEAFGWQFSPTKDFSVLRNKDYRIRFWMKTNAPDLKFDVRFIDTDTGDGNDHPWRMNKTIDNNIARMDGTWERVDIPLKDMAETGSWHNDNWYNPEGKFDWTRIDIFQFVAEHHDLQNIQIFIDEIEIINPSVTILTPNGGEQWPAGSQQIITWTSQEAENVKIEYSTNNGTDWQTIVEGKDAADSEYEWTVTATVSDYCFVRITDESDKNILDESDGVFSVVFPAGVNSENNIPAEYELFDNYPNPFNAGTMIKFGLPYAGRVRIDIFNSLGQMVGMLTDGYYRAGYHEVLFHHGSANNEMTSGIYYYRILVGDFKCVKKMILIK